MTAFDLTPATTAPAGASRLAAALRALAAELDIRASAMRSQPLPLSERMARDIGAPFERRRRSRPRTAGRRRPLLGACLGGDRPRLPPPQRLNALPGRPAAPK